MRAWAAIGLTVGAVALAWSTAHAEPATFQGLGDLPGGPFHSLATGVSGDGSTVVGVGNAQPYGGEAFLWKNGVMSGLGDLPGGGFESVAMAASGDGSVVVGFSHSGRGDEPFRWENGVMTPLGFLPNAYPWSRAYGVSADGTVIVGSSNDRGFRWDSGAMSDLGSLAGGRYRSDAYAVSADGLIIVGSWGDAGGGTEEAYIFERRVMSGLGYLPGAVVPYSRGAAISADGCVVVGDSKSQDSVFYEAFRWEGGMMTALGGFPRVYSLVSNARDVSGDGTTVVGGSRDGSEEDAYRAFIWTGATGMLKLSDVLSVLGVDVNGWWLTDATGVSDDGLTIVGYGYSANGNEGWIATLPADWIDQVTYELTVSIAQSGWSDWGTVDVEPNLARYFVGKAVTLTGEADGAKAFKWWKLYDPNHPNDPNYITTDANNPLTLVMTADRQVVAVFRCAGGGLPLPALTLGMLGLFALIRRRAW